MVAVVMLRWAAVLLPLLLCDGATGTASITNTPSLLAGLPALPKPHYSWPRRLPRADDTVNDSLATLKDYGRITHSLPLYLGRLPSAWSTNPSVEAEQEWDETVRICAEVNCTVR